MIGNNFDPNDVHLDENTASTSQTTIYCVITSFLPASFTQVNPSCTVPRPGQNPRCTHNHCAMCQWRMGGMLTRLSASGSRCHQLHIVSGRKSPPHPDCLKIDRKIAGGIYRIRVNTYSVSARITFDQTENKTPTSQQKMQPAKKKTPANQKNKTAPAKNNLEAAKKKRQQANVTIRAFLDDENIARLACTRDDFLQRCDNAALYSQPFLCVSKISPCWPLSTSCNQVFPAWLSSS